MKALVAEVDRDINQTEKETIELQNSIKRKIKDLAKQKPKTKTKNQSSTR